MNTSGNISSNITSSRSRPPSSDGFYEEFRDTLNTVQMVLTPILVVVGLIGNIFTIIVVRDRRFKQINCTMMLVGMAISDIVMLLTTSLNQTFMSNLPIDIRALSLVGCKIFFIAYRSAKVSSAWIVVLIAIERFLAVVYPLQFKTWMRRKNVVVSMVIIYVVAISYNIVWSRTTKIRRDTCFASIPSTDADQVLNYYLVLLRGIQYSFIPIVILISVTPPIIYKLARTQKSRRQMVSGSAQDRTSREINRTTVMLILVVVLHVVASMPFTVLFIRSIFYKESIFFSSDKTYLMFFLVSPTIEQINHSSNFFIYVLFSKPFRQRVKEIIRCQESMREDGTENGNGVLGGSRSRLWNTASQ